MAGALSLYLQSDMYGDQQMSKGSELESMGEGDAPEGGAGKPIQIPAASLPPGIKEGDCLRCTGMDKDGCTFTLEAGEGSKEEGTPWESDFRASMSPAAPQQGAA